MQKIYTGGCRCGQLRYEIAADPIFMNHCQCRDCQHVSGTGHGSYLTFPSDTLKKDGKADDWVVAGDSGSLKRHGSCRTCGSPVWLTFDAMPEIFTVHAAGLDDPSLFEPQCVTYASRGHNWDHIDPGLARWETMPGA